MTKSLLFLVSKNSLCIKQLPIIVVHTCLTWETNWRPLGGKIGGQVGGSRHNRFPFSRELSFGKNKLDRMIMSVDY